MHVRMPLFPGEAIEGLAAGLVAADRPAAPIEGEPSGLNGNDLIEAGAKLLDLGCIQCHPLGSHALPGTVGVNLEGVAGRVDPDWFRRLLRDPAAVRPGTKMPAFFGQTVNRSILDGDAERQIAAIWAYLDRDRLEPLPARLLSSPGDFELVPMKEPIVFRTFMRRAGTHAIALGFPQGVHLAFDADHCRLSEAWRGRFLDARGTWVLAKSAPPADPLGGDRITIDRVAPLAALSDRSSPWPSTVADVAFLGYVLDDRGVPTFRHRIAERTILERIIPIEEPRPSTASGSPAPAVGLVRQLSLEAVGRTDREADDAEIWLCVVAGRSIEVDGSSARCADDSPPFEATVRWTTPVSSATTSPDLGVVREVSAEGVERAWTVPLPGDGASLEVIYRW